MRNKNKETLVIVNPKGPYSLICPNCYSHNLIKSGKYTYQGNSKLQFRCKQCFTTTSRPLLQENRVEDVRTKMRRRREETKGIF